MRVQVLFFAVSVALGSSGAARADDLASLSKDPKQWVMPARDYASTRFSPLDQINASNVGKLQAAWMFSVGTQHGQEAAPLIIGDTMYVESLIRTRCSRSIRPAAILSGPISQTPIAPPRASPAATW